MSRILHLSFRELSSMRIIYIDREAGEERNTIQTQTRKIERIEK